MIRVLTLSTLLLLVGCSNYRSPPGEFMRKYGGYVDHPTATFNTQPRKD